MPSTSKDFVKTNEVSQEHSTTTKPISKSHTSILDESENSTTPNPGPVVLPPYFLVPNSNSTIGEQFTPQLPPTVFDKPIGGKAPFIPILPPATGSTIKSIVTSLPTTTSHTLAPPISSAPSRSLTPVEYGAIGIGGVLIFALFAYIYQKYRQYRTSSTGGSYSPTAHHRSTGGKKRGSNDSGGGQSLDVEEAKETITSPANGEEIISVVTVVDVVSEVKTTEEVIEIPVTKTVVNGLQKSFTNDIQAPWTTPGNAGNFHEIISEKQHSIEKPPRKTKTPTNSPEKFTSDKTSASHLNGGSLITVSHAIGGILRSQVSDEEETEEVVESSVEGVSLLGKLAEPSALESLSENIIEDADSDEVTFEEATATDDVPVINPTNEIEIDAGSEYFSADENSDTKNSPPPSPTLKQTFNTRLLRAEDVYNTEIITEDGRRRSIGEDIADSIDSKSDDDPLETTIVAPTENSNIHSEPVSFSQIAPSEDVPNGTNDTEHDYYDLRREIYIQNLINTEKSKSQNNGNEEAEAIVDDILRASQLDSLTIKSIEKDLGTSTGTKPRVRWSDDIKTCTIIDSNSETLKCATETDDLVRSSGTDGINTEAENINNHDLILHSATESVGFEKGKTQDITTISHQRSIEEKTTTTTEGTVNSESIREPDIDHSDAQGLAKSEDLIEGTENIDSVDEEFHAEHRFEFIPPKQPQIFEDDMIVFSNSDQESISTLSTVESNGSNEEESSKDNKKEPEIHEISATSNICEECGGIQTEEFVAETPNGFESINTEGSVTVNHTKWYVPNDEEADTDLMNGEEKSVDGLYIVLSEETAEPTACKGLAGSENLPPSDLSTNSGSGRANKEIRNVSNISYAYIDVSDDPKNEGWPGHLPKNIHSISGVGLFKSAEVSSSSYEALKEEVELPTSTETMECDRTTSADGLKDSTVVTNHQKPIPKFIIPNMDARLTKKRSSRRRQIKSLDSGVHHYYGEYLDLVEFPEMEDGRKSVEKETEEVIVIKPDGTITEEKIVIEKTH